MFCKNCGELLDENSKFCKNCGVAVEENKASGNSEFEKNKVIMSVVKPAICAQLKSPASAKFPVDLISIVGNDETGYQVAGFVDSQNGYGAMIRNDFAANVVMENDVPVVKSATVASKANVERAKEFGVNYVALTILTAVGGAILYFITMAMVGF